MTQRVGTSHHNFKFVFCESNKNDKISNTHEKNCKQLKIMTYIERVRNLKIENDQIFGDRNRACLSEGGGIKRNFSKC